ncbi:MAG: chitosanase [Gammaproteobacteria bacterium]|nr:chitosanase [Gammaproteobacteria bacterium]
MLTTTQRKTAQSILNLFETSEVRGDYGKVTLIAGDTGHLSFGRSQTTLGSGNLYKLLQRYCSNSGARFGARLTAYLPRFEARDTALDHDTKLHNLLRASADDPVMRDTQDSFFDEFYWQPAARAAEREGITCALGAALVYDGHVHGSWGKMRDLTNTQVGNVASAGEQRWLQTYVTTRHHWLATSSRSDLRATVYRMETFQRIIDQGYWGLELPLVVRDKEISLAMLNATPPGCYDGPQPGTRPLALQSPMLRGLDVRLLQLGLSDQGEDIKADGIFGQTCLRRIKDYQAAHNLPATGVADAALIARLVG